MQVGERISVVNEAVRLDVELKITHAKREVVNTIGQIVTQALNENQEALRAQGDPMEVIARARGLATAFFATHLTEEKLTALKDLPQRVKDVASQLANRAGGELMAQMDPMNPTQVNPMRGFLGMMVQLTAPDNLINFFLTQSMGEARRVTEELESRYIGTVLDQVIQ